MATAVIPVKPFTLTEVDLLITLKGSQATDTPDYGGHVSSVEFVPSVASSTWKGLKIGSSKTSVGAATWVCNLGFAQDWETPDSLSNFLLEHEGEVATVQFAPISGETAFEADLTLSPGSIGGAVDATGVSTVALGVDGKPTKVVG